MKSYRKIFPSFQWEDKWFVNQILNLPSILGAKEMHFISGVPPEEVKSSDDAIKKWIDESMSGCSCLILFVGETTYQSKWVKYELQKARKENLGRFEIWLTGMKDQNGNPCGEGLDPYAVHGMYAPPGTTDGYVIKHYQWLAHDGLHNIGNWIEDACERAGK